MSKSTFSISPDPCHSLWQPKHLSRVKAKNHFPSPLHNPGFYPHGMNQADSVPNVQVGERRGRAKDQRRRQERENGARNVEEMADGPAYNRTGQGRVRGRR